MNKADEGTDAEKQLVINVFQLLCHETTGMTGDQIAVRFQMKADSLEVKSLITVVENLIDNEFIKIADHRFKITDKGRNYLSLADSGSKTN